MVVSPFFTDDDLETQIRLHLPLNDQWTTDLKPFFNQIIDRGGDLYLEFKGYRFSIARNL